MNDQGCKCKDGDDDGCEEVSKGGYKLKFYKGFVSRSSVSGMAEPLYVQTGRYDVPGKQEPSAKSMAELDLPDGRQIKLQVDDVPRVWVEVGGERIKRGPISRIVVHLGDSDGDPVVEPAEFADRVQVKQGKKHVRRVVVHPYTDGTVGGVHASSDPGGETSGSGGGGGEGDGDGETWELKNAAVTCPWTCG